MRPQPLLCVRDVEASSRWYQRLLGCRSDHGGPHYERLVSQGRLILQLHRWDVEHHHGPIGDPKLAPGNGVLLWFELEDFDAAIVRSTELLGRGNSPAPSQSTRRGWRPEPLGGLAARSGRLHRRACEPGWRLEARR